MNTAFTGIGAKLPNKANVIVTTPEGYMPTPPDVEADYEAWERERSGKAPAPDARHRLADALAHWEARRTAEVGSDREYLAEWEACNPAPWPAELSGLQFDPEDFYRAGAAMFGQVDDQHVIELAVRGRSAFLGAGFFSDFLAALAEAGRYSRSSGVTAVYWGTSFIGPERWARAQQEGAANRVKTYRDGGFTRAANSDVASVRNMMIDIDRREQYKTAGPATYAAICAAEAHARQILAAEGMGHALIVMSGNGAQIIVRVNMPNDEPHTAARRRFLEYLNETYPHKKLAVDIQYRAAQLCKAPGTFSRKGEPSAERPHRLARVIEYGDAADVTANILLRGAPKPTPRPKPYNPARNPRRETLGDRRAATEAAARYFPTYWQETRGGELHAQVRCPDADRAHAHGDKNPSARYYSNSNRVYCHKCKQHFDFFDVIALDFNLERGSGDALRKGREIAGVDWKPTAKPYNPARDRGDLDE